MITQWAGVAAPDVVDLGAGTGLSGVAWSGRARRVTAVEPSSGMRQLAERRIARARAESGTHFLVVDATAEDTGLPDGCADVVTASQAMHWFDPGRDRHHGAAGGGSAAARAAADLVVDLPGPPRG